jgi:hypothetical protein
MLLQDILSDNRKRKHSLRDLFKPSFNCLKLVTNGVCCLVVFQNGNWFIITLPNGRIPESSNKYTNCYVTKYAKKAGSEISPSLALIDSQSVKTTRLGGES